MCCKICKFDVVPDDVAVALPSGWVICLACAARLADDDPRRWRRAAVQRVVEAVVATCT